MIFLRLNAARLLTTFTTQFPAFLSARKTPSDMRRASEIATLFTCPPAYFAVACTSVARATRHRRGACAIKIPQ
jgi:hypothetical protein